MIEIPFQAIPPLAILLGIALAAAIASWILLAVSGRLAWLPRVLLVSVATGLLLAAASAVFVTSRGAGTGTLTGHGWPRQVHTDWRSWESPERIRGMRWQGVAENALFYGAAAGLAASLAVALLGRRRSRNPAAAKGSRRAP